MGEEEYERLFEAERASLPKVSGSSVKPYGAGWKPLVDDMAFEVHSEERMTAIKQAQDMGVPTDYVKTETGWAPRFESRGHRNRFLKASGNFDRAAGYGDHTKQN